MTTLPKRLYGNPLDVLLKAEAETCKGCAYVETWRGAEHCMNPNIKAVLAEHRCDEYKEIE